MATAKELDEFEILRRKQKQQTNAESQVAGEGIRRRFAALGSLSSGAAIKQEQLAKEAVARRGQEALGTIDIAQAQQNRLQKEADTQRAFQAEQAGLGREHITGERVGSQSFGAEQAQIARGAAAGESALERQSREAEQARNRTAQSYESSQDRKFKLAIQDRIDTQANLNRDQQNDQFFSSLGVEKDKAANSYSLALKQLGYTGEQIKNDVQKQKDTVSLALKNIGLTERQIQNAEQQYEDQKPRIAEESKFNRLSAMIGAYDALANSKLPDSAKEVFTSELSKLGMDVGPDGSIIALPPGVPAVVEEPSFWSKIGSVFWG